MKKHLKKYFSEENILAIKISFFSFVGLIFCIMIIIVSNRYYLLSIERKNLSDELVFLEQIAKNRPDFYLDLTRENFFQGMAKRESLLRTSRDIIVIRKDGTYESRGIFAYVDIPLKKFFATREAFFTEHIGEREYLFAQLQNKNSRAFFSRDITFIEEYQKNLLSLCIFLSIFFLLIIFFISKRLANITIKPIQENNTRLKEYNHYVAHELKTPLAVMKSNLELLEISQDQELFSSSQEEIEGMQKIIDGLLFLSETGIQRKGEKIDIRKIIQDIKDQYLEKDRVHISSPPSSIFLVGNLFFLERLMKNLLENAFKYSPKGTDICIEIKKKSFSITNATEEEISQKEIARIFEPFYQIDTSRSTKGHGLGLAIVKRVTELSGWDINTSSNGKSFTVEVQF